MTAFRKFRSLALLGFAALLTLGLSASPAAAGRLCHVHRFHYVSYPKYFANGYGPAVYRPFVRYVVKPYSYPVTLIDTYGQPYVVWQTRYQTVPTTIIP